MKYYHFLITAMFLATCHGVYAQFGPQFENSGFEQWTSRENESVSEPVHWHAGGTASGTFSGFLSNQMEASDQTRPDSPGTKSVRIFPTRVLGVTANGNMTNGRMNAGSMSATGTGNYNYTQRSESAYNTPIDLVPDSIALWVCFRSESATQKAQLHAAVHGDADYRFVADGTEEPANMLVASARHTFTRTSTANGAYVWHRLSVPFIKDGPCNDPRYILFTITTNEVPGQGSDNDDLFVDDIELIYNPNQTEENLTDCQEYPNPCPCLLHINSETTVKFVTVYDLSGKQWRNVVADSASLTIDLGDLPTGVYLIQLDFGDKKAVRRIMKL